MKGLIALSLGASCSLLLSSVRTGGAAGGFASMVMATTALAIAEVDGL